jgi:hypothetical protein
VLDDQERRGQAGRQPRDDRLQGGRTAGGGADHHRLHAARLRRLGRGTRRDALHGRAQLRRGQRAHLGTQLVRQAQQVHVALHARFVHEVQRAQLQPAQGDVGPLAGQRGQQQDRRGALAHDAAQRLQAVDPRHLHVQRDDRGAQREHLLQPVLAVDRGADHLDVGRVPQHPREGLAHERRVVDHQDPDHGSPSVQALPPAAW